MKINEIAGINENNKKISDATSLIKTKEGKENLALPLNKSSVVSKYVLNTYSCIHGVV